MAQTPAGSDADGLRTHLEVLTDRSMPGRQRASIGSWVLRSDRGATRRANCLWPSGDPGRGTGDALDRCEAWLRSHGRRPRVMVFDNTDPALIDELDRRGYGRETGAVVMTAAVDSIAVLDRTPGVDHRISHEADNATEALAAEDGGPVRLAENSTTALPQRFVTAWRGDDLVGGAIVTIDGDWAGLFSLWVTPAARGQGLGRHLLALRAQVAAEAGALNLWLQVRPDNPVARSLFSDVGFETAHAYHYRVGV